MIPRLRNLRATAGAALLVVVAAAACGTGSSASPTAANGKIQVTAAENFWGSIASQLGGNKAAVTSIITNPDTDPHTYQPTAQDGRAVTTGQFVIYNGIGYDPWAPKLLATNSGAGPTVLNVGQLVGVPDGGNPHRWYSPSDVQTVINTITADYKKVDPKDAGYFDSQNQSFVNGGLAQYNQLIAQIKSRYSGVPVGASESIFAPMAQALGLNLLTPPSFLEAISEGTDPTAQDKATIDAPDQGPPDQGVRLQLPERHARRAGPGQGGQGGRHTGDHHHRDPRATELHVPGLAGAPAPGSRRRAGQGDRAVTHGAGPERRATTTPERPSRPHAGVTAAKR